MILLLPPKRGWREKQGLPGQERKSSWWLVTTLSPVMKVWNVVVGSWFVSERKPKIFLAEFILNGVQFGIEIKQSN
jgi:hypothetical protein